MKFPRIKAAICGLAALCLHLTGPVEAGTADMVPLPQDLEVELALSALPAHLRDEATILVLDPTNGYKTHRQGSNGFTTLVGRTSTRFYQADWEYTYPSDQLIPVAYDQVGVDVHLKPWLDIAQMRANGTAPADAKQAIRARFADGTYAAPEKGGISYMLAPIHRAYLAPEQSGEVFTVSFPHYMPYAPHVSGQQLGNHDPSKGAPIALTHGMHDAGPHGYLVFMLPPAQIASIREEYAVLLERLCAHHENWCLPEGR